MSDDKLKGLETLPVDYLFNIQTDANILGSHCKACIANQERFGLYSFDVGLRGEVIDVCTRLKTFSQMYGLEEGLKLLNQHFELCSGCKNYEGSRKAEEIGKYFSETIRQIMEQKKKKEETKSFG